ncbi:telomere-protecting terminal protein Tpg [Streptomyces tsukubensis]|uniref:telomere-protecting terminal protein Tpg n=1 Tax=Streptomyces tsukubensis TaxID=83656 RepID=UPI00344FF162
MGKIFDAFRDRFDFKGSIPKTARGQLSALLRKEKGSTKRVAERLGVSQRTVQRYVKGDRKIANSNEETLKKLRTEVSKDHRPRVHAKARKEAKARGLMVETRASFGFTANEVSTDDPRVRRLTEDVPDHLVDKIFDALQVGDEDKVRELIAEGLAEEYFRAGPGSGLDVEFTDIDYIELQWRD